MVSFDNTEIAFRHKTDADLRRARFLFTTLGKKWMVDTGKTLTGLAFSLHLPVKPIIKATLFRQFVGGENIEECSRTSEILARYGVGTILDYSVEGKEDEQSFDATTRELIRTVEKAATVDHIPFAVFKVTGICSTALLTKLNRGESLSAEEQAAWERAHARVLSICSLAAEKKVKVLIDAEESWIHEPIDRLAGEMMERFNKTEALIYNTTQMYRHDRLQYIRNLHTEARERGYKIGLKIVRGAYMEKERAYAAENGLPDPIQPDKAASDADYNAALEYCTEHMDDFAICAGTHNERSSLLLVQLMEKYGIRPQDERVYFAQLLGMSDNLSFNLSHAGYHVAKYVPYGPVKELMPYLFRRAEENTSVKGQTGRELSLIEKEILRRKNKK
ncbi:MAG: proline dehydrogenase family protein [Bacteroidia bacterium]|nr:proline dehydrogenase family protein [Bacteroidia bacterium]